MMKPWLSDIEVDCSSEVPIALLIGCIAGGISLIIGAVIFGCWFIKRKQTPGAYTNPTSAGFVPLTQQAEEEDDDDHHHRSINH